MIQEDTEESQVSSICLFFSFYPSPVHWSLQLCSSLHQICIPFPMPLIFLVQACNNPLFFPTSFSSLKPADLSKTPVAVISAVFSTFCHLLDKNSSALHTNHLTHDLCSLANPHLSLRLLAHPDGEGNGTPLQYPCLENPMDGGAWKATVHGVTKSQTRLSDFTFTFHFHALEKERLKCYLLHEIFPDSSKPLSLSW